MGQAPQLLERGAQLDALAAMLRRAAGGRGGVAQINGRAGTGKSVLLDRIVDLANDEGACVAHARALHHERSEPYEVVRQLARSALAGATPRRRAAVLAAVPQVAALVAGENPGEPAAAMHDAFLRALLDLTQSRPLVACVDDMHWCDPASLATLEHLTARARGMRLLLATTGRPGVPALAGLDGQLQLGELSASSVARLARRMSAARAAALHRVSGGNPLLVAAVVAQPDIDPPAAVIAEVECRLARAGVDGGRLAAAAAVLGDGATLGRCARLAGLSPAAASAAADSLAGEDVLAARTPVHFVAPLLRSACYAGLARGDRARLHLRAATLLDAEGEAAERCAEHLVAADPCGDERSLAILRDAAAAARAGGAPDHAARYLRRALDEPVATAERAQLLAELGADEAAYGAPQAPTRLQAAIRVGAARPSAGDAAITLSRLLLWSGRYEDAIDMLESSLARGDSPPASAARLESELLALAQTSLAARRAVIARRGALPIEDIGGRVERDPAVMANLALESAITTGSAGVAIAWAERALGDGRLLASGAEGAPPNLAGGALVIAGEPERGERMFDALVEDAERRGSRLGVAGARCWRARARLWRGAPLAAVRRPGRPRSRRRARLGTDHAGAPCLPRRRAARARPPGGGAPAGLGRRRATTHVAARRTAGRGAGTRRAGAWPSAAGAGPAGRGGALGGAVGRAQRCLDQTSVAALGGACAAAAGRARAGARRRRGISVAGAGVRVRSLCGRSTPHARAGARRRSCPIGAAQSCGGRAGGRTRVAGSRRGARVAG